MSSTATLRPRLALVGALMLAAITLTGCNVSFGTAAYSDTRHVGVSHVPDAAIDITTHNGSVEVVRQEGIDDVRITATIRAQTQGRLDNTTVVIDRDSANNTLRIYVEWPNGVRLSNEQCSFIVHTPGATGARISSSNGALRIAGLSGEAVLTTSNGRITVDGHNGDAKLRTSNGRITATNVAGTVNAQSSNGRIELTEVGGPAEVRTSNGSVSLTLAKHAAGPVNVQTSNGSVSVVLGADHPGPVVLSTSNGRVRYVDANGAESTARGTLSLFSGKSGPESRIRTSNGSVSVRVGTSGS